MITTVVLFLSTKIEYQLLSLGIQSCIKLFRNILQISECVEDAAQAEADANDARFDVAKEAVLQGPVSLALVGIYLAMFNKLPTQGLSQDLSKRIPNPP